MRIVAEPLTFLKTHQNSYRESSDKQDRTSVLLSEHLNKEKIMKVYVIPGLSDTFMWYEEEQIMFRYEEIYVEDEYTGYRSSLKVSDILIARGFEIKPTRIKEDRL